MKHDLLRLREQPARVCSDLPSEVDMTNIGMRIPDNSEVQPQDRFFLVTDLEESIRRQRDLFFASFLGSLVGGIISAGFVSIIR